MADTDLAFLQYPPQSVGPLDDGGLFVRAWYLVFNQIGSNFTEVVRRINAALALIPLKMIDATQSQLVTIGPTLSVGQLVNVTDYAHVLQWTGTGFKWGPGELGSGMMQLFEIDPTGVGWHLYDGTVGVKYLKSDGTTGTVTLLDLVSSGALAVYPKAGSPNGGPTAASAPTFTGNSVTTGNNSTTSTFAPGTVGTVTVAGTPHTHSVTPTGTISSTGEPRNIVRRPFFRQ